MAGLIRMQRRPATFILIVILAISNLLMPGAASAQVGDLTPIYAIQGTAAASPHSGEQVNSYGVVTGVTSQGFFLQDPAGDGDPLTSDGLYVYTRTPPSATAGACVIVRNALVDEFYDKTELARPQAIEPATLCSPASIEPVALPPARLGTEPAAQFERYEGMLVRMEAPLGVVQGPTKHFSGGEQEIAFVAVETMAYLAGGRVFQEQVGAKDALMYVSNRLGADLPAANWGDTLDGTDGELSGVVDYAFGKYQLLPLSDAEITVTPAVRPNVVVPTLSPDAFTVCSYNLYGFGRGQEQYPDPAEYTVALASHARLIAETLRGCTIVGLQETGMPADAANLAVELQSVYGLDYTATAFPGPSSNDAAFPLTNSLLTRTDQVTVADAFTRQGCSSIDYGEDDIAAECPAGQYALFSRPPLVADLLVSGAWGAPFSLRVIDNHWKSKSGDESVNAPRRMAEAHFVASLVQQRLDTDPAAYVIVLGDLNDFYPSAPLDALAEGTTPPLVQPYAWLPRSTRYTYIFDGASQVLDHILITPSMVQLLAGIDPLHVNADFARPATLQLGDDSTTSDHDPLWMALRPGGAAALGADLGFPGIGIEVSYGATGERVTAQTDAWGQARVWGLPPGEVTVRLTSPAWIELDHDSFALDLPAGYTMLPNPGVHHMAATAAAHAAISGAAAVAYVAGIHSRQTLNQFCSGQEDRAHEAHLPDMARTRGTGHPAHL